MLKQAALALVAVAVIPAHAKAKKPAEGDVYTYDQFKSDCLIAGGKPVFTVGTAACDFPGDWDIVCDAGGGSVRNCRQGTVLSRFPKPRNRAPTFPGTMLVQ